MNTNRLTAALKEMSNDDLLELLRETDQEALYWKINRALQGRDWRALQEDDE